jgi:hypothetical protein
MLKDESLDTGQAPRGKETEVSFTVPDEAIYRRDRGQIILEYAQIILKVTGALSPVVAPRCRSTLRLLPDPP